MSSPSSRIARRAFLSSLALGPALRAEEGEGSIVTDFGRSYLFCTPRGAGIWVRVALECRCWLLDRTTNAVAEYVLGVKAQTGLSEDKAGGVRAPGYEYWMVFSRAHVWMKRVHTSAYFDNPTRVSVEEFGAADWHLEQQNANRLRSGAEVRAALQAWQPLVARSEFLSTDRKRVWRIEYPVKWADCHLERDQFRVETGPVLLLNADRHRVGELLELRDFQWAHLDYHSFDHVRCLVERPTPLLAGATYQRQSGALTPTDVKTIEDRLFADGLPRPPQEMRRIFETDRFSEVVERPALTTLFAISGR
jgi:hypothetical protein